ncbi:hypothetical protein [Nocardioides sp. InS609-2]|uniref:hypothetical protein n=1 Tax=Nocardioides sp. InS609-2 TaxID=2760705 RepID=UPI0020C09525|nr:hypothetical protein [Nocardioides sp. InS609-2]
MHVQDVLRAAAFVQVVNVLGDHQEVVAERLLEAAERHRGSRSFPESARRDDALLAR